MRGPQIFQNRRIHLTTLGVKNDTRVKFHVGDPTNISATVRNLSIRDLCTPVMERTKLQKLRGATHIRLLPTERTHSRGTTRVSTAMYLISKSTARDALLGCDNDTLKLNKDIVLMLMNFPS